MELAKILNADLVKVPLAAKDKKAAITELVDMLFQNGRVKDRDAVLTSVLEREATRTTGVGHGLAIPHAKCSGVGQLVMAVGKPAEPIDFQSIDGENVFLICLLVSPPNQTAAHLQALAKISRLMSKDTVRTEFKAATTTEALFTAILAQDKAVAPA